MRAARPLFPGHEQPVVPGELGYYDLRDPRTRAAQAELARSYGVTAFCYWHYWFAGRQVLDLVFEEVRRTGEPDFPFCLGWANQSWTGVWHGAPDRVLIEQTYPGREDHVQHFEALEAAFCDPRYLRVEGRPVFYVQDPWAIPEVEAWTGLWQRLARRAGLPGLFLVGEYRGGLWQPQHHGFDGSVAIRFPAADRAGWRGRRQGRDRRDGLLVVDYSEAQVGLTSLEDDEHFPCLVPRWDHTPRSGSRGLVLRGSTPELFRHHACRGVAKAMTREPGLRLLWIKSWNEWAEGNMLEPESRYGRGYLESLRQALNAAHGKGRDAPALASPPVVDWWRGTGRGRLGLSRLARRWAAHGGPLGHPPGPATTVPVVLCVDCEPDLAEPGFPSGVESVRAVADFFDRWRDDAARATGRTVRMTWLLGMHGQVAEQLGDLGAVAELCPAVLSRAEETGDLLGVSGGSVTEQAAMGKPVADRAGAPPEEGPLVTAVTTFEKLVGHGPEAARFTGPLLTTELVEEEEKAGIRFELGLEPGRSRPAGDVRRGGGTGGAIGRGADGRGMDWSRVPRLPYFPSHTDYRYALAEGTRPLRIVPMTTGPRWLGGSPLPRLHALRSYGASNWKQRDLLDMAAAHWTGPDDFGEMLRRTLAVQPEPFLALCITTDWVTRPDHRRNVERCLASLLRLAERCRLAFVTPAEACELK